MEADSEPREPAGRGQNLTGDKQDDSKAGSSTDEARDGRDSASQPDPDAKKGSGKASGSAEDSEPPWGNVFQHFHGNVYAEQGFFGMGTAQVGRPRSEERRVGKEGRYRGRPYH